MKVLLVLTYYRPHVSGLTVYAERVGAELARRGHDVTVLTSQYARDLPREERANGVRVVRVPVVARVSKGVIMPTFGWWATRLVRDADVVSLHLPQFDAAGVALRGRLTRTPTTVTYHCDLSLPPGAFNRAVNRITDVMNLLAGRWCHRVVAYTDDFAEHSPFLTRYASKRVVIPPPIEVARVSDDRVASFRSTHDLDGHHPVIGMAARLASEKGVENLLDALPRVLERHPTARVLFAGQHRDVLGESGYARRLTPSLERVGDRWTFLGVLDAEEMAAFYANIDVIAVPSLNSTESFGFVQVEAMMCGTPAVASDLPGVRQPVRLTGMGEIVPVGDAAALADAICRVVADPSLIRRPDEIRAAFSTERTVDAYEELFERLLDRTAERTPRPAGRCRGGGRR